MTVIAIGDIHGRTIWQNIVQNEKADAFVFIGDYFDSHENISVQQQIKNFDDIIRFKEQNADEVILLTGNHDYHYLSGISEHYSGYNRLHAADIGERVTQAVRSRQMQMCYVHRNIILVHAGFTKTWCRAHLQTNLITDGEILMQRVNDLFFYKPEQFGFTPGDEYNVYGDEVEQSPIWVRPASLKKDRLDGFVQIVGHTTQKHIQCDNDIWLIDALDNRQYLFIENEVIKIKRV